MTILTTICEQCAYGSIDESDKARIKITCSFKNKTYYFGQYVPCDYYDGDPIVTQVTDETDSINNPTQQTNNVKRRGRPKGSKNKPRKKKK